MPEYGKSSSRFTALKEQTQTSSQSIFMVLARNSRKARSEFVNRNNDKKGISQEELAEMVGVSTDTIKRYESGIYEGVRLATVDKMAVALGITPQELLFAQK